MKERYCLIASLLLFLITVPLTTGFIFDVIGNLARSVKRSVVVSAIKSKLTALRPRFVPFQTKGRLVRDGAVITFLIAFLSSILSGRLVYKTFLLYRRDKTMRKTLSIPLLFFLLSLSILGLSFSAFWLGEYLIHLPISLEALVEKHA